MSTRPVSAAAPANLSSWTIDLPPLGSRDYDLVLRYNNVVHDSQRQAIIEKIMATLRAKVQAIIATRDDAAREREREALALGQLNILRNAVATDSERRQLASNAVTSADVTMSDEEEALMMLD
ncbi:hypothetical protein JCM9279_003389 [Rhodotorula babjevae]